MVERSTRVWLMLIQCSGSIWKNTDKRSEAICNLCNVPDSRVGWLRIWIRSGFAFWLTITNIAKLSD